ncbi:MAG: WhiB family transcriptional regulator [Actinomycetes bacterium]
MTRSPDLTWIDRAACRDGPSHRFIEPADDAEVRTALSTCQRCPVRQPCLDTALSHRADADVGIWGGTTPRERRQIRRSRQQPEAHRNGRAQQTDTRHDNGHRQQTATPPPDTSHEQHETRTRRPTEVSRLPAPEITVARDKYGDYTSADGRVLIFRIRGALPWVLAIDDEIIGASRTVTEARRTAWTTLHQAERTDPRTPGPTLARAHGGRR